MGEGYLPKRPYQFLLLFQLILLNMFQMSLSHGYKQRQYHPLFFGGGWFWVMCGTCVGLEKNIYLSKFTCEIMENLVLRFAREPLDFLWVFCDLGWRRKFYVQDLQGHFKTSHCKIFSIASYGG